MKTSAPGPFPASLPRNLGELLEFAVASHARVVAFLCVVCLVSFLPGFFNMPPIDRDESRFAQATKQMIESGDYVDIRYQNEVRYKKPVGIYWLQAGVVRTAEALGVPHARSTIWLYRVPSLIGAIGGVLLTYWTALAFLSRRYAYLAGLIVAASVLLGVEARFAKTDAMLLLTIVAAMGILARAYLADEEADFGWLKPAAFWTAIAGGILLKGPLILMIVALTSVALVAIDRSARWLLRLRPLPGILWMLVLVLPWFLAILSRAGDSFFVQSVGQDLLGKVATGQETHGAPPGYYLALFWITFWPAAPLAAVAAPFVWRERRGRAMRFLLAWAIPSWIVFEIVVTKLPHYVLPLYPAIAIMIGMALERRALSSNPHLVRVTVMWPIVTLLASVGGIAALIYFRGQLGLLAWPFAGIAFVLGFLAWRLYDVDGVERSFVRATIAAHTMTIAVFGVVIPLMRPMFPSAAVAETLRDRGCPEAFVAAAGYHEPSVVFLVGTSTRLVDGAGAAELLRPGGTCRFALVEVRQQRSFAQRAEALGLRYTLWGKVEGFNYNGGRAVSFAIYRAEPRL